MTVRRKRVFLLTVAVFVAMIALAPPVLAVPDSGQVSTTIENTWKTITTRIKTVTNSVIFPVMDCVLAILLFIKLAMAYFDCKKHGEFGFTPIAILFFGLVFTTIAPTYIWDILGTQKRKELKLWGAGV